MNIEEQRQQIQKAFFNVFASDDGKLVLRALKSEYYDMPLNGIKISGEEALRYIGQRDVIEHVLDLINEGKELQADE